MNNYAFIVPFLNNASWLEQFIEHYTHILSRDNNYLIFVEGVTAFHNSAEHRNGHSIDGSIDIIKSYHSDQIKYARQGKVHLVSELLNTGFRLAETPKYICPLKSTDFIPYHIFERIEHTTADGIRLKRVILAKDFKSCLPSMNSDLLIVKNIEGLAFKNGNWIPFLSNKPITKELDIADLSLDILDTHRIETKIQCSRRILQQARFKQWTHHNVEPIPDYRDMDLKQYTTEELDNIENSSNTIEFKGLLPESLREHPWSDKTFPEIWNYDVSFPNFGKQLEHQPQRYKKRGKLLEIGCATGQALKVLKDRGWEIVGVDPSLWATGYAKHLLKLDVRRGVVTDINFPNEEFDAIVLWDTFEHIPNPNEVLTTLTQWLKPDGLLIIYTPDFNKFGDEKDHWLWSPRQHFFLYTPDSLSALLTKNSFHVTSIDAEIDLNGFLAIATKAPHTK